VQLLGQGGNLNTAKAGGASAGTQTCALYAGGLTQPAGAITIKQKNIMVQVGQLGGTLSGTARFQGSAGNTNCRIRFWRLCTSSPP
jgi:hypothetical protein